MMRRQIKQAEATVASTRRQRLPDISAGLEARNYTGDGSFRQGVLLFSMNVPWVNGGKYRSEIQRDEAKLKATELDLVDYELSVREEVHQLTVKIDAARREAVLYRDQIIPAAKPRWTALAPPGKPTAAPSAMCWTRAACCSTGGSCVPARLPNSIRCCPSSCCAAAWAIWRPCR